MEEEKDQEILKMVNMIKRIYIDGCKLTPVNPELELEYSIFLYEQGLKDESLKKLLLINFQELSIDSYYKFYVLKETIHIQQTQDSNY